jgi:hypothetical protein
MKHSARALAGLLLLLAATGCFRRSDPVVLHVLRPLSPMREGSAAATPALEVMPVRLPEVLQRTQLVTEAGAGALSISERHRWANGLDKDVQRVLTENLSALLGSEAVVSFPDGARVKAAWRLELDVQRLDGRPGGMLFLRGSWMLVPAQGGPAILRRRVSLDEPVGGPGLEALAAAHDRVLDRLSREIAASAPSWPSGPAPSWPSGPAPSWPSGPAPSGR